MNILETLLKSQGGDAIKQAGRQFGLDPASTEALLSRLVPALSGGIKQNLAKEGGLQELTKALASGDHKRYVEDPSALQEAGTVTDGNAILSHLFGSKDVSRKVAGGVAADTGLDTGIIKKFLPIVAAAAMGALSKQTAGGARLEGSGGVSGLLNSLLDSDGDGQMLDNLLSLGKKSGLFRSA